MATFDVGAARKAGYSNTEIADHLATQQKFDAIAARKAGYSDEELISHLLQAGAPFSDTLKREKPLTTFLKGTPELGLKMLSESIQGAAAGIAGIGAPFARAVGMTDKNPVEVVEAVRGIAPTFEPGSKAGKYATGQVGKLMDYVVQAKDWLGDKQMAAQPPTSKGQDAGLVAPPEKPAEFAEPGSPLSATIASMIPDVALSLVGAKGTSAVKPRPTLNIGTSIGDRIGAVSENMVRNAVAKTGGKVTRIEHKPVTGPLDEATFIVQTDRPLTQLEVNSIAAETGQSTIPQSLDGGKTGQMFGPGDPAHPEWSVFNPDLFKNPSAPNVHLEKGGALRELRDVAFGGRAGAERAVRRHHQQRVGSVENIEEAATALETFVPNVDRLAAEAGHVQPSPRTASDALADIPSGTPLVADQQLVSATGGGPSAESFRLIKERNAARESTIKGIEDELGPKRAEFLQRANEKGAADVNMENPPPPGHAPHVGVKVKGILRSIEDMKKKPGIEDRAVDALNHIKARLLEKSKPAPWLVKEARQLEAKLNALVVEEKAPLSEIAVARNELAEKLRAVDESKLVDATDLYTQRGNINETIEQLIGSPTKQTRKSKAMTSRAVRDVRLLIDDVIERSGGAGWKKEYMEPYAKRSQMVEADVQRTKRGLKPLQITSAQGPRALKGGLPHVFSRTISWTNYLAEMLGKSKEPLMLEIMAQQYRNPEMLARALRGEPGPLPTPPSRVSPRGAGLAQQTEERLRKLRAEALRGENGPP